jgi:ABC-type antimicrobial peptide transport system permease subunit
MLFNYFKISLRQLIRSKGYSAINIGGLAAGLAVAMFIGLWTYDEFSSNKNHLNYETLSQVMIHRPLNDGINTSMSLPLPVSEELQSTYSHFFEHVAATWRTNLNIKYGNELLTRPGIFTESALPEMLSLEMLSGTRNALSDNSSILISESLAKALFSNADPMGQVVDLNFATLQVAGVYKDLPGNSSFTDNHFFGPLRLVIDKGYIYNNWLSSSSNIFVQVKSDVDRHEVDQRIADLFERNNEGKKNSELFLNPMSRWRLYGFENGVSVGERIRLVLLISVIGLFVVLLACINFVNLTTARAEKRTKEVGIRKAIGSLRRQLMQQFFSETFLVVAIAFVFCLVIVSSLFPAFNELSGKKLDIPWSRPSFWIASGAVIIVISFLAGIYPALYLSSFRPVKVLKGTFKAGRFSSLPRKVLVVLQFSISVVLVTGTIVVYTQIDYVKKRGVGYERNGLISIQPPFSDEVLPNYEAFRNEILATKVVLDIARSSSPTTNVESGADNLDWPGRGPDERVQFGTVLVDPYFDQVVKWKIKEGRNFSDDRISDSLAFIFNEAAIRQMGLSDPIDQPVKWHGKTWTIIGVVEDMVMASPFSEPQPTVFLMNPRDRSYRVVNMRVDPNENQEQVLSQIGAVFRKFSPNTPFVYTYADQEYAMKFAGEERTGRLALVLTVVAIVISCLGLFGLASFIAEQKTKEIGIRKVVGATVFEMWLMITREFVLLVTISIAIAIPLSYYFLNKWLSQYAYHTDVSLWVFAIVVTGSLATTVFSVGYQAIEAATANPVKSLRSE